MCRRVGYSRCGRAATAATELTVTFSSHLALAGDASKQPLCRVRSCSRVSSSSTKSQIPHHPVRDRGDPVAAKHPVSEWRLEGPGNIITYCEGRIVCAVPPPTTHATTTTLQQNLCSNTNTAIRAIFSVWWQLRIQLVFWFEWDRSLELCRSWTSSVFGQREVKWILLSCPLWFNSIGIVQGEQQSVVVVRILLMSCPVSTELCIPVTDFCCGRCCPSGLWSWTVCCCGGQWFANSWINLYSFEFLSVTILISVFFVGGEFVYLTFGTHSHWLTIYIIEEQVSAG